MARFILDVAINGRNEEDVKDEVREIMNRVGKVLENEVSIIRCIDMFNTNQFYNSDDISEGKSNELTVDQIANHDLECDKV